MNDVEIKILTTEIMRVVKDLNALILNIEFSETENNKTLDEIMNEITTLQSNIAEPDSDDIANDITTKDSWNSFVNDVKIIIENVPPMNEIALIPVTLDSELYIKYVSYYYKLLEIKSECEKVLISNYNIKNDLKFIYYAFKQIAFNTHTISYAYNKIVDFEVKVSDVFDADMQHWNIEYAGILQSGVYSNTTESIYAILVESLQLLHKYCAFIVKLSESGFEQFTGVASLLNDVCAATTSVMKYYDFVKINI